MSDHPSSQDLHLFLRGELPAQATRRVIVHLLKGCAVCRAELEPRAVALLTPSLGFPRARAGAAAGSTALGERTGSAELDPVLDAAYDAAFERALAKAREIAPAAAAAFTAPTAASMSPAAGGAAAGASALDACDALLERCRQLRHEDARQLLEVSTRAVETAEGLRAERHGPAKVAELQAYSWAELANAHRVSGELRLAEVAMAHAFDRAAEAHGEDAAGPSLLLAHLYDLQASLFGDQRRLDEALALQDLVYEIRMQHGDLHGAGRALISKGVYTGYGNDPEGALRLLAEGRQMVDAERDPQLVLFGIQNTAAFLVDLGRLEEAGALVQAHRIRYQQTAGRADRLRLLALSGLVAAGLGDLERAEQELLEAKRGLEDLGFGYRSALAALELSGIYLRLGQAAKAREAAEEAMAMFSSLGVGREALGALMLLQQSFELGQATAVVDRVADFMRRAAHDSTAHFEPVPIH